MWDVHEMDERPGLGFGRVAENYIREAGMRKFLHNNFLIIRNMLICLVASAVMARLAFVFFGVYQNWKQPVSLLFAAGAGAWGLIVGFMCFRYLTMLAVGFYYMAKKTYGR